MQHILFRTRRAALVAALCLIAQAALASEFSLPPGFPPAPAPTPTPPGAPPVDPTGQIFATSAQLGLQSAGYTMYMLSNKFWPSIVAADGYASNQNGNGQSLAGEAAVKSSDFRLVSYDENEGDGSWNHSTDDECCPICDRQVWFTGYGVGGNAHNGDPDLARATYGLGAAQFGFERQVEAGTVRGLFGEYTYGQTKLPTLDSTADAQTFRLGLYLRREWDCNYYLVSGCFGVSEYDSIRNVDNAGTPARADGDYDGWEAQAYIERGMTFRNDCGGLQPYIALHYIYLRENGFSETGGGSGVDEDVAGIDAQSLRGILGARYQYRLTSRLTAELRAAWWHEFLDTDQAVTVAFTGLSGTTLVDPGLNLGRDSVLTGFGFNMQWNRCLSTYVAYDCHFNDREVFHLGSGGIQYNW